MTEIAYPDNPQKSAYRLTRRACLAYWTTPAEENVRMPIVVEPDGAIIVPYNANRYHRFQVARISEAQKVEKGKPFGTDNPSIIR